MIREYFKRWPKLYYLALVTIGNVLFVGLSPTKFLKKYPSSGKIVNLGSGPRIIREDIINVDITKYEGVSIVASLTDLPFEDNSVGSVICDNVLEHVKEAHLAVGEMERVLKRGGVAYISTPFMYPFHSSPYDYHRWSEMGLRDLFSKFEVVEFGVRAGVFSALNSHLCYLFATIFSFGSEKLYWILLDLSLFLFFPIKFLDVFLLPLKSAKYAAAVYYMVVRKK
jgi:SAM-dependent methyltransferase